MSLAWGRMIVNNDKSATQMINEFFENRDKLDNMTNREYLQSLSIEELIDWLKEPYKGHKYYD